MNTIRCLVVDDEPLALEQMATYVGKTPFLTLVGKCRSAEEASKLISMENVDAMFVDINMPDLNGLDFVRSLVAPLKVVLPRLIRSMRWKGIRSMRWTICSSLLPSTTSRGLP